MSLGVKLFRPTSHQEPFFVPARQFLLTGGNRSGKSTCAAAKVAAIATDTPIEFFDGSKKDQRFEWQKGRPLRILIVSPDDYHLGGTIYRLLFQRGLFKTVAQDDGSMRFFRQWDETAAESQPVMESPPLISATYARSVAWEKRDANVFRKMEIVHPDTNEHLSTIHTRTGKCWRPLEYRTEDPFDVVWMDEAGAPGLMKPCVNLTADCGGQFIWSKFPEYTGASEVAEMLHEAKEQSCLPSPRVKALRLLTQNNKHLDRNAIDMLAALDRERSGGGGDCEGTRCINADKVASSPASATRKINLASEAIALIDKLKKELESL